MKPASAIFISFTALCLFSLSACEPDPGEPKTNPNIIGNWQWVRSVSGWGATSTPAADSTVILKFATDSTYTITLNNIIKLSGPFHSFPDHRADSLRVLNFNNYLTVHQLRLYQQSSIVDLKKDTLRLYDYQIADGSTHLFVRKP